MIVIKGMEELPGKCVDCPLFDWHFKDCLPAGGHSVDDDPEFDIMTGKPDWCPLVFLDTAVMPTVKDGVVTNVETRLFDIVEEHHNCFVQILTNSVTGEISIGWKKEESK